jgi:HlyD family secretion protein
VRAPFAGMLTSLVEEEGASVAAGQLVARVSELNNYRVEATLSDFHARQLAAGQPVRVEQNGEVLAGRVHTILPEIQNGTIKLLVDLDSRTTRTCATRCGSTSTSSPTAKPACW